MTPFPTRNQLQSAGYNLTFGFGQAALLCLIVAAIISVLQVHVTNRWRATDATDGDWRHRSGFALYTDHGTGCQYLQVGGALTPRLSAAGAPMCGAPQ